MGDGGRDAKGKMEEGVPGCHGGPGISSCWLVAERRFEPPSNILTIDQTFRIECLPLAKMMRHNLIDHLQLKSGFY